MTRLVIVAIVFLVAVGAGYPLLMPEDATPRAPGLPGSRQSAPPDQRAQLPRARRPQPLPRQRAQLPNGDGEGAGDAGGWETPGGRPAPPPDLDQVPRGGGRGGGGRALRPASPLDPSINIQIAPRLRSAVGSAFSIDSRGIWMTARHVVDSCPRVYVLTGPRQGMQVQRVYIHPSADIAILQTRRGARPLQFSWDALRLGMTGFHFGFPKGNPGDVRSRLIGRRVMRVHGRYRTAEPVVAWTEQIRVPNTTGGLGGISGGPVLDGQGRIIGVTVAGTVRRGRVYTTALTSVRAALQRARINVGAGGSGTPVPANTFPSYGNELRARLRVAKVVCLVPRSRRRSIRRPSF